MTVTTGQPAWVGSLDPQALLDAAASSTGLDDFGDARFLEPLRRFLGAIGSEARLSEAGVAGVSLDVVRLLTNRLLHQADLRAHPQIAEEVVEGPIVIAGLPRTGTTKLHRMLALHEQVRGLPMWRSFCPARIPGSEGAERDPRIAMTEQMLAELLEQAPGFLAAHPMSAEEVDEETFIMQGAFDFRGNGLFFRVPAYVRWLDGRAQDHCYEHLREVLRYIQWQDGGGRGPWVLKSPVHLGQLDAVVGAFPQAVVVHCHRDPAEAVPSLCRLVEHIRRSRGAATIDLEELGDHILAFCREEWERNLQRRALVPAEAVADLSFRAIVDDGVAAAAAVLERRGLALDDRARAAMEQWQAASTPHQFGRHEYTLERYGLTRPRVMDTFAEYFDRFGDLAGVTT